jgi:hypothetical protein
LLGKELLLFRLVNGLKDWRSNAPILKQQRSFAWQGVAFIQIGGIAPI